MPYNPPRLPQLIAQSQTNIQSKLPGNPSLKYSVLGAISYNQGAMISGLYDHQKWIAKQAVPSESDDDIFMRYAGEHGIFRKPASVASGTVMVNATQDAIILKDSQLQRADGALYRVVEDVYGIDNFVVKVESIDAGLSLNVAADVVMNFISPIIYVQSTAIVQVISGGADIEPMQQMRERYIFRCQYPPMGGSRFDYVRWMRECAGVTRAWCWPRVHGGNTVGVAWVYDDRDDILPTDVDYDDVMSYLDYHPDPLSSIPIGHSAGAEVVFVPIKLKPLDLTIKLYPDNEEIRLNVITGINNELQALSSPGQSIPRSHITQAISNAVGEFDHVLVYPPSDQLIIESAPFELLVLGVITWQ